MGSGFTVARDVEQDENGVWIFGYNRHFGECLVFYVELWSILDGLNLIERRGHDNVIIQSDSLEAIRAIQDSPNWLFGINEDLQILDFLTREIQEILEANRTK
ncbi:hypothetical protein Gohar_011746, partial [Gossypium harknessii]|nr:hypothetical protein [Gossypium harknessii]